jgi:hypothetical protein
LGSRTVATLIRKYTEGGYNAVVFNQCCKSCGKLGTLKLDKQCYVGRVAYLLKVWACIRMERQHTTRKKGTPHESTLCEGCKQGYYPKTNES